MHHTIIDLQREFTSELLSFDDIINEPDFIIRLNEYLSDNPIKKLYYIKLQEYCTDKLIMKRFHNELIYEITKLTPDFYDEHNHNRIKAADCADCYRDSYDCCTICKKYVCDDCSGDCMRCKQSFCDNCIVRCDYCGKTYTCKECNYTCQCYDYQLWGKK